MLIDLMHSVTDVGESSLVSGVEGADDEGKKKAEHLAEVVGLRVLVKVISATSVQQPYQTGDEVNFMGSRSGCDGIAFSDGFRRGLDGGDCSRRR